jgi:hypothetical protein
MFKSPYVQALKNIYKLGFIIDFRNPTKAAKLISGFKKEI